MEWRGGSISSRGLRRARVLEAAGNWRQLACYRKALLLRPSPLHCPSSDEGPSREEGDKALLRSQTSNLFDQLSINFSRQRPHYPSPVDCTGSVCL